MNKILFITVCLLPVFACAQTRPAKALSDALHVCGEDYRENYLKRRSSTSSIRMRFDKMTREEVQRSHFARLCAGEELTEPEYIHVSLSNLPKNAVGGSAHYLVSPESGKIIARYHTR